MKSEPAGAPMDPDRWQQVSRILADALDLPAAERTRFLDRVCAGDSELRAEVASLIEAAAQHAWIDSPAAVHDEAIGATITNDDHLGRVALVAEKRFGPYLIVSKLGQGGMGVVYRAIDTRLGRPIALKLLSRADAGQHDRARFIREAHAASALNHPNIATVYEFDTREGIDFIAMEYVEGATLRDVLHENKTPLPQLLEYARQTARAVSAAHAAGIVHRDLKPANIMIADDGTAKVLDFGLAKIASRPDGDGLATHTQLTVAGSIMGTPAYMSPEQVAGEEADHRADIFAVGVILYEMACGKRPFEGPNAHSTLHLIATTEPRRVAECNPGAPPPLIGLIDECLRKRREERLQSMTDAVQRLAAILAGTVEATTRPPSRRSFFVALSSATAAVVCAVAGYWFLRPVAVHSLSCSIEVSGQDGRAIPSSFRNTFASGTRFRLTAEAKQPGYLYILSGDPASPTTLSVLSGGLLPADQRIRTEWQFIEGDPGSDRVWFVWSSHTLPALDKFNPATASNLSQVRVIIDTLQSASPALDGSIDLRGTENPMGTRVEIRHR